MAAALVPLITTVAPSIISLIAGLVHKSAPAAETQFGPSTGPVKFATVFGDVMTGLQNAAAANQIDKTLPPDQTVQVIIQSIVTSMKLQGMLTGMPTTTTPALAPTALTTGTLTPTTVTMTPSSGKPVTFTGFITGL